MTLAPVLITGRSSRRYTTSVVRELTCPASRAIFLHGDTRIGHDADERGSQLPRGPVVAKTDCLGELLERPAHVSRVQRGACRGAERQPVILPDLTSEQPLPHLLPSVFPQRFNSAFGQR